MNARLMLTLDDCGATATVTAGDESGTLAMSQIIQTLLRLQDPSRDCAEVKAKKLKKFRSKVRSTRTHSESPVIEQTAPTRVEILERLTPETLTVYWSDARTGHYADQIWRLGRARANTFCVLTGVPICVGDQVYRPFANGTHCPPNRDFMISAEIVWSDRLTACSP